MPARTYRVGVEEGLSLAEAEEEVRGILRDRLQDIEVEIEYTDQLCEVALTVSILHPTEEGE
jgi:hypothetical protein